MDGSSTDGGWLNHHYIQLAYQLADCVSGLAYSFFGTCIILFLINLVPGLRLRASEEEEVLGIDDAEIGEFAVCFSFTIMRLYVQLLTCYQYDYVEVTRDVVNAVETEGVSRHSSMYTSPQGGSLETKVLTDQHSMY